MRFISRSLTKHRWLVALLVVGACGGPNSDECPSGTSPSIVEFGRTRIRECRRPDGSPHGPVIETNERGQQRRIGQWNNGKKAGVWRAYVGDKTFSEATYVDGDLRTAVTFQEGGQPLTRAEYREGVAHGKQTRWNEKGLVVEREFTEGRRSGTWRRYLPTPETRVYDQRGVLQSVDGTPVPPPRAEIQLPDGKSLTRDGCGVASITAHSSDACHDLFEAFQLCESEIDPARVTSCHERAFAEYRRPARL
jgi:hypothetical protein